jgi:hypothetical protein
MGISNNLLSIMSSRNPAPHVQAALARTAAPATRQAAQAHREAPAPGRAPHVEAAIARSVAAAVAQARPARAAGRAPAPHVEAALAHTRPLGAAPAPRPAAAPSPRPPAVAQGKAVTPSPRPPASVLQTSVLEKRKRDEKDEDEDENEDKESHKKLRTHYWETSSIRRSPNERKKEREIKKTYQSVFKSGRREGTRSYKKKEEVLSTYEGKELLEKIQLLSSEKPPLPQQDRFGNKIWNGARQGLDFSAQFRLDWWLDHQVSIKDEEDATDPDQGYYVCVLQKEGCKAKTPQQGYKDLLEIDHIQEASIHLHLDEPYLICDGANHWWGFLVGNPPSYPCSPSRERPTILEIYCDDDNLQPSCNHCNPSKNGKKGRDLSPPVHLGPCPETSKEDEVKKCTYKAPSMTPKVKRGKKKKPKE